MISEISTTELKKGNFETLPCERILVDLLDNSRLTNKVQIVNGLDPDQITAAVNGEPAVTIIYQDK